MAFNKYTTTLALAMVFLALVSLGDAISCYKCMGCSTVNSNTPTCQGSYCYEIEQMSESKGWDRGCTPDPKFCIPHAEMPHGCEVCSIERCNDTPY